MTLVIDEYKLGNDEEVSGKSGEITRYLCHFIVWILTTHVPLTKQTRCVRLQGSTESACYFRPGGILV